jgi:aryl-alcohol dehydrogenase-like predicted oxidoreductase
MVGVFRPKDIDKTYRKSLENAIKDLAPDTKDSVAKLLNSWQGSNSKEELSKILGPEKTEQLLKNINLDEKIDLTDDERKRLRDILRDSLTFD